MMRQRNSQSTWEQKLLFEQSHLKTVEAFMLKYRWNGICTMSTKLVCKSVFQYTDKKQQQQQISFKGYLSPRSVELG